MNVEACKADYDDTPRRIPHPLAANLITQVIDSTRTLVLSEVGLWAGELELTAALAAGLNAPDLEARWLARETILSDAPYIPSRQEDIARMANERGQGDLSVAN
jgi:hypothetical protein